MKLEASTFYLVGFWVLEPSHYAIHRASKVEGTTDLQPSVPLSSQPTTGQACEYATLQVDPPAPQLMPHRTETGLSHQALPELHFHELCEWLLFEFTGFVIVCYTSKFPFPLIFFHESIHFLMANFLILRWEPILVSSTYIMPDFSNRFLIIVRDFCGSFKLDKWLNTE